MVVDSRPALPVPKRPHLIGFVALSLVLHGLLFWWFKPTSGTPDKVTKTPDPVPIQARLVFATPEIEETPSPLPPSEAPPEPVSVDVTPEKIVTVPDVVEPEPEPKPAPTQPVVVAPPTTESVSDKPISTPPATVDVKSAADMARRHLQQFQQSKQDALAEQAARDFQTQKTSPVIPKPTPEPYMTENEKLLESIKITANCDKTGAKALAIAAAMLGGTIECNRPPDFQQYIDRRVNKGQKKENK